MSRLADEPKSGLRPTERSGIRARVIGGGGGPTDNQTRVGDTPPAPASVAIKGGMTVDARALGTGERESLHRRGKSLERPPLSPARYITAIEGGMGGNQTGPSRSRILRPFHRILAIFPAK